MKSLTYIEVDVPTFTPTSPETTETFRFAMPAAYLPPEIDCIPSVRSINFTPARVSLGKDLGQRASLTISFTDHKHIFAGESYDAGSFWGKWRGRYGVTLRGRSLRIIRGQVGQALADMDTRHYSIENMDGPTLDGVYTFEAKDVLKFADEDRAQAPVISTGRLAGSIDDSVTAATLTPAGVGDLEYPASGYLSLGGKEVVGFTRVGNALTITRGEFGSIPQDHDANDRAQLVLRYDGDDPADIIHDLLVNYAGVPSEYIELAEWQAETDTYLGALYARTITEPTSVRQLVNEMIEQAALVVWWDDRAQRVRLSVLRDIPTDNAAFTQENIFAGSLRVSEQPGKRISQIWTLYGTRDPTDRGAEDDNYRASRIDVELEKQGLYGSAEIRKIRAGWIETATAAERLNSIQLSRFQDPPRAFSFDLPITEQVAIAAGYTIEWWANQNELGEMQPTTIQITQVALHADRIHVEAEEMLASGTVAALINVVFLTTTGSVLTWEVDPSWNDADNSIHAIGGGAGGGASGVDGGRGGGGGAYSAETNVPLQSSPPASISYRIGTGGIGGADDQPPFTSTGTNGGDTWFNSATFAGATVGARGGEGGSGRTGGGDGGQAASGIGSTRFSGGNGGTGAPKGDTRAGGGGGGGAAGPAGDGANGGSNTSSGQDGGAGGGAANAGSSGSGASGNSGGQGGNNRFAFGGGSTGASGAESGGGGGGDRGDDGGQGGAGEQIWTQTINPIISAGPGGGGGGAGDGARAGKGGRYGGGGGGNGGDGSAANDGEQGIIVLMWREA